MSKKINLLVLDIDDTLTKSENQHQTAFLETMHHFGITKVNTLWASYQHMTDSHILKVNFEKNLNRAFDSVFENEFENLMTQKMLQLEPVSEVPGASKVLKQIIDKTDFAICFATGSYKKPAILKLKQAGIKADGNLLIGSNRLFTREEIVSNSIEAARKHYKVSSFKHIISIGDGMWDWRTARKLNLEFIGIGEKSQHSFNKENIPYYINDWNDKRLVQILNSIKGR